MSGFDDNPFADPATTVNPFSDPSIQRATQQPPNGGGIIDDYNPFENQAQPQIAPVHPTPASGQLPPDPAKRHQQQTADAVRNNQIHQPAVMQPVDPAAKAKLTAEELQKRQEELDRRAADLEAREEALRNGGFNVRAHNWPPLPSFLPIKPCFYQDIGVDIPLEFQRIVRTMYYLWGFYALLLIVNVFGGIALLIEDTEKKSYDTFGGSIVSLVLYVPLSFVGWFRPVYRAFRSDSSLNFMIFFLVFTVQVVLSIVSTIGIVNYGAIGVFTAIYGFKYGLVLGIFLSTIAVCQGLFALACFIMLMRVHALYRGTTASFQRAQAEFASGVLRNEHVQQAAANVAAEAARQTVQSNLSGSRY
ncbi:secretory carrier-associated membrane protein 1-like [Varroa jacobsoni]|uniref:Secretory carrier-associated membrane protein n=1 Tax=Varroa destructor TaxID=109461 RepID=A0A7M7K694_VARDE|nr:secretory carrier-associated membrane protein 1-like [Varroa destructor]XP_022658305.1 secretory carrier-associated membrane protein 1-like [Varroa destructor]XP_022697550.1 secretory carrier-associated membrane protein 1-like [Varroa jacobsoni]XP_022697551.1 secretory carrier-associated membrane protein 1-like [Varroa jacobsoni]